MAMLLQNFDFRADDPSYDLRIRSNLTIKPEGFYMRATLRRNVDASHLYERLSSTPGMYSEPPVQIYRRNSYLHLLISEITTGEAHPPTTAEQDTSRTGDTHIEESEKSLTVLYGSNTGTCQSFAHKLATDARARSFSAKAADMDSGTNALPTKGLVVIITASYEGLPPDNATQFVAWLESLEGGALNGVQYAIFGCGHKDWSSTFLRIPKVVDGKLRKLGAKPIVDLGVSDASRGDMFSDFDSWTAEKLWPAINAHLGFSTSSTMVPNKGISMEISTSTRATQLQHDVQQGKVLMSRCLTAPNEPEKRHLEVTLPEGMEYQAGDYLAVLPLNPEENVHRVLTEFSIPSDAVVTMKEGSSMATIPADRPVSVFDLLRGSVELSLPATRQVRYCYHSQSLR
jgi:cytochrome P450/NADPH-cytochrome P450 reductase